MLKINEKLREVIKKAGLNQESAEHVCFAIFSRGEDGLNWCHEQGLINSENEHKYRIALTEVDGEGNIRLRHQLVVKEIHSDFIEYYIQIGKQLPNTKGKLDNTKESRMAFEALVRQIENFDQNRLIEATIDYYKSEEFSKKLSNFLTENALLAYETYEKKNLYADLR